MSQVEIKALKPFAKTTLGEICEVGEKFFVEPSRATELQSLKLAEKTGKTAPKPSNKMAPEPENKSAAKPVEGRRKMISGRD